MKTLTFPFRIFVGIFFCVMAALWLRFLDLNHIPGLNGDEAWLAMQVRYFFAGEPFKLQTPTHRWISPTFAVVQGLFQLLPWTGVGILRTPTALASVATVLIIPLLFRRILSQVECAIFMLLVACMPIQLTYARVLGEMSQVPLAMAILLALVARGRTYWALVMLGVATTIHPTCMLAAPILFFGVAGDSGWRQRLNVKIVLSGLLLFGLLAFWQKDTIAWRLQYTGAMFLIQVTEPDRFVIYLNGIVRTFTGANVAESFVSSTPGTFQVWSDLIGTCLLVMTFGYGSYLMWRGRKTAALWNLFGVVISFLVLYLIAAPAEPPLEPGFERYALYLMVPLAWQVSALVSEILQTHKNWQNGILMAVLAVCVAMLVSFETNFIQAAKKGGATHFTYKTAEIEPKYAAFDWIQKDFSGAAVSGGAVISGEILAESWWSYWSLAYFNSAKSQFRLKYIDPHGFTDEAFVQLDVTNLIVGTLERGGYLVGFKGEFLDQNLESKYTQPLFRQDFRGYSGEVLVSVWRKMR